MQNGSATPHGRNETDTDARPTGLDAAITAWRGALGDAAVEDKASARSAAEAATFVTQAKVWAIVSPATEEQLCRTLAIATEHRVPAYPVSTGFNWGYGSRVPTSKGAVIVSLQRMQRIHDYDGDLGVVEVEPGVTFAQLNDFLSEKGGQWYLQAPGSTDQASVVGNVAERGLVLGIDPERAHAVLGLRAHLPSGELIDTGFGSWPRSVAATIHAHAPGPSLHGLFLQSNLAIIGRLRIRLTRRPGHWQGMYLTLDAGTAMGDWVGALRLAQQERLITTSVAVHNDYKILSLTEQYPYAAAGNCTPLPPEQRKRMVEALGGGSWFVEFGMAAPTASCLQSMATELRARISPHAAALDVTVPNSPSPLFGSATGSGMAQAYWRKRSVMPSPPTPEHDRVGLMWLTAILPFCGGAWQKAAELADSILIGAGFEPNVTFHGIDGRYGQAVVAIVYDRDASGDDARAETAHEQLQNAFLSNGWHPTRLLLGGATRDWPIAVEYRDLIARLKRVFDPAGILAPGRYDYSTS